MRLASVLLIFCGTFAHSYGQDAMLLEVNANCGPWIFKTGGLNADYPYGRGDHLPPVVVKADGKLPFRKGELIQITYLDKRVRPCAWNYDNSCNSEGETLRLANDFKGNTGNYMPSHYIPPSEYPIFLMALIGVFADEKGAIIGSPFKVGLHRTVQVPVGATQLQLGINDDWFQAPPPNLGSYRVILKKLSQPNLVAPQQPDQEVDLLLGEGGIGISTHQMLGDCRVQSIVTGGAAEKEGTLKKNDVILAITDDSNSWINIEELKLPEIRRLFRGSVGTEVKIRVMRPEDPKKGIFEVRLKREKLTKLKSDHPPKEAGYADKMQASGNEQNESQNSTIAIESFKYDKDHWKIENSKLKWIGGKQEWRSDSVVWFLMGTNDPCIIRFTHKKNHIEYPEYHVSAIIYGNGNLPSDNQDPWIQGAILDYSKNQGWLRTNGLYKAKWVQINRKAPKIDLNGEHKCVISYSNNYLRFFIDDQKIVEKGPITFESKGSYLGFPVYWNNKLDEYEFSSISINDSEIKLESP